MNCIELRAFVGVCIDCYFASARYWKVEVRNKIRDISTVHNFHDTRTEFKKFILKTKLFVKSGTSWNPGKEVLLFTEFIQQQMHVY